MQIKVDMRKQMRYELEAGGCNELPEDEDKTAICSSTTSRLRDKSWHGSVRNIRNGFSHIRFRKPGWHTHDRDIRMVLPLPMKTIYTRTRYHVTARELGPNNLESSY